MLVGVGAFDDPYGEEIHPTLCRPERRPRDSTSQVRCSLRDFDSAQNDRGRSRMDLTVPEETKPPPHPFYIFHLPCTRVSRNTKKTDFSSVFFFFRVGSGKIDISLHRASPDFASFS